MARLLFWRTRTSDGRPALTEQERSDRRHRRGWYSYAFASEAFVIVAMSLFMPVALEQYARENGKATPDLVKPCTDSTVDTDAGCKVYLGGRWISSTSFSLYVSAASMGLQLLTVISMSALADHPRYRKSILLGCGWLGALAAILYIAVPSSSGAWPLAMPLTIIANVGYGVSFVALNAYLPGLAARDPQVLEAARREGIPAINYKEGRPTAPLELQLLSSADNDATDEEKAVSSLTSRVHLPDIPPTTALAYNQVLSRAMAKLSAYGTAIGCSAGIVLLLITLVPVILLGGSMLALRIAIALSGAWWAAGSVLTLLWLRGSNRDVPKPSILGEIARSWRDVFAMIKPSQVKKMQHTFRFLAAWFLLSDGLTTITATAILFARTELHMPATSLIILGALVPSAGIVGALIFPVVQRKLNWSTRTMILLLVSLAALLPLYGCIGIPLQKKGVKGGGLTVPGEMYGAAVYFGLVYAAFQSFSRSLYGEIIPPDQEARWYALFSIADKSSTFIGPLIVGAVADATDNIRWGFLFLLGMILVAIPVLLGVDVQRGRMDSRSYRSS